MFDIPLAQLPGLTLKQKAIFRRAGLNTPSEVLLPPRDLLVKTLKQLTKQEVDALVFDVAKALCPKPTRLGPEPNDPSPSSSAVPTQEPDHRDTDVLSFGDPEIDALLGGGVRKGMVTEIVGESSAGKSQLCLLLALASQLASLHPGSSSSHPTLGSVAYLSSEGKHPSHSTRLQSLAAGLLARHPQDPSLGLTVSTLTSNILFDDCHDVEGLDHTLSYRVPALIERLNPPPPPPAPSKPSPPGQPKVSSGPAKPSGSHQPPLHLLILDSLTALLRTSFPTNSSGLSSRSAALCALSDKLHSLAYKHNLAVLVVNQVTDVFSSPWHSYSDHVDSEGAQGKVELLGYRDQSRWFNGSSWSLHKEASLGLVWANCVNARIMLSRTGRYRRIPLPEGYAGEGIERQAETSLIRRMEVVFGSGMRRGRRDYVVWEEGIWGLAPPPTSARSTEDGKGKKRAFEEMEEEGGEGDGAEVVRRSSGGGEGSSSQKEGVDEVDVEAGQTTETEDEFGFGDEGWMGGVGEGHGLGEKEVQMQMEEGEGGGSGSSESSKEGEEEDLSKDSV